MEKQIKEYEKIFLWVEKNITFSDSLIKLEGCEVLVEFFRTKKFKEEPQKKVGGVKNPMYKEELDKHKKKIMQLHKLLVKSIKTKRNNLYLRNHRQQGQ